jgi:hypothetical protein
MKKALTYVPTLKYWHRAPNGEKIEGLHRGLKCEDELVRITGDCTSLVGVILRLYGDVSGLSGDCTGLIGDCSDFTGNLDDCELTADDRAVETHISELVGMPGVNEKGGRY